MRGTRSGYHNINAYINAEDAEALIGFLTDVFDGRERGEREFSPDGTIGHAEVAIGDSVVMISQASETFPARLTVLFAYTPDVDATHRAALSAGAVSISTPRDQPWGDRVAGFYDPWGNRWWVATARRATGS
jgi:PhnB protein